uniref:NADH dehydrogenase subunit 6 n=1 Tax=Liposcelis entomophila TaxID=550478 RepID=A0A096X717_9NEOP|nr:NADH dehydrogenase subunit 6 [Liposcelis entomophila]AHA47074.1 NADH dehydrogenase subunit 6 [Liposcelis entomophila]
MIWQIYFWLFSSSTLILILSLMLFLFFCSNFMYLFSKNQWCTILFVIFLIGGLMVSFFYMVSIDPNNFKIFKLGWFFFWGFILFYFVTNFNLNFFFQVFMKGKMNCIQKNWKKSQINYLMFIMFILLYLIIVMIFVNKKLKFCKKKIKEG